MQLRKNVTDILLDGKEHNQTSQMQKNQNCIFVSQLWSHNQGLQKDESSASQQLQPI